MFDKDNTPNNKKPKPLLLIFIIAQAILIIFILISLPQVFNNNRISENEINRQPQVTIKGLSEVNHKLTPDNLSHLQRVLFNMVKENSSTTNTSLEADIQPGSIKTKYFDRQKTNYFHTILNIPQLNQSYYVFYEYTDQKNNTAPNDTILILCGKETNDCRDIYEPEDLNRLVFRLLKYFDFEYFTVDLSDTGFRAIKINSIKSDYDQTNIEEIKNAIESLGVPSDTFEYHINQPGDFTYMIDK